MPESVTYTKNSVPLFSESYQYDDIGNIEFVTNNGATTTYFYDSLNQLTKASSSDGTVTKYFYNDGGNINYKVNADGSKTHYVYDSEWKDLLVSFGGQSITYDEIGNPINYLGNTMSWTGRTLDSIVKADGTQISYTYDLDGIRTKKVVGGVTTEYFVNGTTILAQKTGNDIIWFIYDSDGQILGFTYNDTPYYYVKNLQGDVLKVIDANGNVVASYTYDPWGKLLSATGSMADINPIRYRGYYYDSETGLYYLNSRYYDPDTCRFVNPDTTSVLTASPMSMTDKNLYAYCDNNPIVRVDNGGQFWDTIFDVISLAVSIIDVVKNPDDPMAWIGLAGDALDLIPFVTGVGETVRAVNTVDRIVDTADTIHDMAKTADNFGDGVEAVTETTQKLHRPYIRKSTRIEVEMNASRLPDGRFLDANTGIPINGKYDLGHVPGHEFWREREKATKLGWTQKQFNDYMNNPSFYQIEDPWLNRSHVFEMK